MKRFLTLFAASIAIGLIVIGIHAATDITASQNKIQKQEQVQTRAQVQTQKHMQNENRQSVNDGCANCPNAGSCHKGKKADCSCNGVCNKEGSADSMNKQRNQGQVQCAMAANCERAKAGLCPMQTGNGYCAMAQNSNRTQSGNCEMGKCTQQKSAVNAKQRNRAANTNNQRAQKRINAPAK